MVIIGTRPEAVKLAPLVLELAADPDLAPVVTLTGQHREMVDQILELFAVRGDHDLDILQPGQTLTDVTVRTLTGLERVLDQDPVDGVIVQGDTTTAFAGSLAAFYQGVPVFHVEAGLRTATPRSPFPEEMNRRLTTRIASLHLAPTPSSAANLRREAVEPASIVVTGNTVIDALRWTAGRSPDYGDPALVGLDADRRRVLLVTAHRRESWGPAMEGIGAALAELAADPDLLIVFPIHRNPVVRESIIPRLEGRDNVIVVEPLGYAPFVRLMARADVILSDSGGVQEEGPALGRPVLVMRESTERPEAITAGCVSLVGTDPKVIVPAVRRLFDDPAAYEAMSSAVNPYGDGRAARRSADAIAWFFGLRDRPEEFSGG